MQLDSENDRQMLLAIMGEANIKGKAAVPFALLMERVASATVLGSPKVPDKIAPAGPAAPPTEKPARAKP